MVCGNITIKVINKDKIKLQIDDAPYLRLFVYSVHPYSGFSELDRVEVVVVDDEAQPEYESSSLETCEGAVGGVDVTSSKPSLLVDLPNAGQPRKQRTCGIATCGSLAVFHCKSNMCARDFCEKHIKV